MDNDSHRYLVDEMRSIESELRTTLRGSATMSSLGAVVIALIGSSATSSAYGAVVLSIIPLLLTVVGLQNVIASIDAAQMAEQRDWLAYRARVERIGDYFITPVMANSRRLSLSSIAANALAGVIVLLSWVMGLVAAWGRGWFVYQVIGTAIVAAVCAAAAWEYVTIRKRVRDAITTIDPSYKSELEALHPNAVVNMPVQRIAVGHYGPQEWKAARQNSPEDDQRPVSS